VLPSTWTGALAIDINDNGVVVGYGNDGSGTKGFVFNGSGYTKIEPAGWVEVMPQAINNNGVVTGKGIDGAGAAKGFMATPIRKIRMIR